MTNPRKMELEDLVYQVKVELKKKQYSDTYIGGFITVWNRLAKYMNRSENALFTAKIGIDFLEAEYGITVYRKLNSKNRRCARAVNVLSDFLLHGIVFPRTKQAIRGYHPQFQPVFQGY